MRGCIGLRFCSAIILALKLNNNSGIQKKA